MNSVLVIYNDPVLPDTHPEAEAEREVLEVVEVVEKNLREADYDVCRLGISHDPGILLRGLREMRPDVVFNLFEGTADDTSNEAAVAALLEWLRIPYTGCPSQAMVLARNKPLAKRLLQGAGLPTPAFAVLEDLPVGECRLEWPVIVKAATQDASVGLDQGSVVTRQKDLETRVRSLLEKYGPPILVEHFIPGREFNVGVIETPLLRALPIEEIEFQTGDGVVWPIVTYDAKWKPGSRDDLATPPRCPAAVMPELEAKLQTMACQAFRLLGCRDYARVDFRLSSAGDPYILEVNPNPDFYPTAGFAKALAAAQLTHAQFTLDLIRAALGRRQEARPVPASL